MSRTPKLRIGAVEYLNTKPLVYGLSQRLPNAEIVFDLPSHLADRLASGGLDVALIPSVEFLLRPDYQIVSNAVIACRGPVWSVRLLSRVPISEIRSLALDEGSRTSAILVQILLWETHRLRPQLIELPMAQNPETVDADALLLIGDRAMHPHLGRYQEIWDLGDRWCRLTELPFVFALWAAPRGRNLDAIAEELAGARDEGCCHASEIAAQEAGLHGLTHDDCLSYFTQHLHYRLGQHEWTGLREFAERAHALGLLPDESVQALRKQRRSQDRTFLERT